MSLDLKSEVEIDVLHKNKKQYFPETQISEKFIFIGYGKVSSFHM